MKKLLSFTLSTTILILILTGCTETADVYNKNIIKSENNSLISNEGNVSKEKQKLIYAEVVNNYRKLDATYTLVTLDTTNQAVIETLFDFGSEGRYFDFATSPDGKKIIYNKWVDKMELDLFLYDIETKTSVQLTSEINGELDRMSWLDDQTVLCVFSPHGKVRGIHLYKLNLADKSLTRYEGVDASDDYYYYNAVKYIAGTQKILYARGVQDDYKVSWQEGFYHNALYMTDLRGEKEEKIAEFPDRTIGQAEISPNGKTLAIEAYVYPETAGEDKEPSDIYLYDLNAKTLTLIDEGVPVDREHWDLFWYDDRSLLYRDDQTLYRLDIAKKESAPFVLTDGGKELRGIVVGLGR